MVAVCPLSGFRLKSHQCLLLPMIVNGLVWQRQWKNDVHMAIRDLNDARHILATSSKAHHYLAEALSQVSICTRLRNSALEVMDLVGTSFARRCMFRA